MMRQRARTFRGRLQSSSPVSSYQPRPQRQVAVVGCSFHFRLGQAQRFMTSKRQCYQKTWSRRRSKSFHQIQWKCCKALFVFPLHKNFQFEAASMPLHWNRHCAPPRKNIGPWDFWRTAKAQFYLNTERELSQLPNTCVVEVDLD